MKNKPALLGLAPIVVSIGLGAGLFIPSASAQTGTSTTVTTTLPLPTSTVNVIDQLKNNKNLSTLVAAIDAAGLSDTLRAGGPYTIFAPDNIAFDLLGNDTVTTLLKPENRTRLASTLGVHIVPGRLSAGDLQRAPGARVRTSTGSDLDISRRDGRLTINGAGVRQADIVASNAVIHIIDTVLTPAPATAPSAAVDQAKASGLKTFVAAVDAAGLTATLQGPGPFTMFVPDDVAFELLGKDAVANLLKAENKAALVTRLQGHVVSGRYTAADIARLRGAELKTLSGTSLSFGSGRGRTTVGKAGIVKADIITSNGVIHIIDTVL